MRGSSEAGPRCGPGPLFVALSVTIHYYQLRDGGRDASGPPLQEAPGIGALTLGGILTEQCAKFPDNEALVFDDPLLGDITVRWSYRDLEQHARRVAKALLAAGIGKGARVGILMGNRPEAVASVFGAALAGAIALPLSTFSPKPELSYLLAHADISVLLLQTAMGSHRFAADVAELCPSVAGRSPSAGPRLSVSAPGGGAGPVTERTASVVGLISQRRRRGRRRARSTP